MKKIFYITLILSLFVIFPASSLAEALPAPSYASAFVYNSGSIRLNWDNSVTGAARYTVQRSTDNGNFITLTTLPSNISAYNDSGIANGHTYTYRVFATRGSLSGEPAESNPVEYLYPSGLSTNAVSDSEIELTWTYPYSSNIPETNFQTVIERRNDGSSTWQTVATVPGTEDSFTDGNLTEATRYYYRIRALTATSAVYLYYPNTTVGQHAATVLKAPSNATAKVISAKAIEISWMDISVKETGYLVERKKGNGAYLRLKTLNANAVSYIDNTPVNGEQYTYRITAQNSSFSGTPGQEVTVPFLFPVSLQIKETYSRQITLGWSYPNDSYISPDSSTILIERRSADSANWGLVHTTRSGETEYTDSGLEPGTRYSYRIRSRYNEDFTTDYFPTSAGISGLTKLSFDSYFYGCALSATEIRLEWDKASAANNTIILEKMDSAGMFEALATLNHTGYYIDTVPPGSINTYRMKVKTSAAESDYTGAIDITAEQLPVVSKLSVKAVIPQRVFLAWEYQKALESGFEIWRMAASEGVWKQIGVTGRGQWMYSDENIVNGESYTYRVRAVKSNTIFSPLSETGPVQVSFSASGSKLVVSKLDDTLYLGWDDFSDMEQVYIVEFKTSANDTWHVLDKLPKNMTLYRFIPAPGIDYTLRVRAYSESPVYESISSEQFYSTKFPSAPSLVTPSIIGAKRIVLIWADMSDNEDEFIIYRKNNNSEDGYKTIGTVKADTGVFSDESVLPDQTYTYVVRAKNAAGESFGSNEMPVQTPLNAEFIDLESHPWARDAIEALSSMGIVNGDGKGHYNPSGNVTRAEFIKLLIATFSFPETPVGSFKDVTPEDWYHRWIMTAYRKGIVEPDENGMFYPGAPITRQDIVYFSVRAVKAAGLNLEQPPLYILYKFSDYDQVSGYAQSAFAAMNYAGIINGIGNNKLGPLNPATRAEAAAIIHRMIQVLEKQSLTASIE